MSHVLIFQSVTFEVIDRDNQLWIKASQLAKALGYSDERKISHLYQRHADEFTVSMTQVIEIPDVPKLGTTGLVNKSRIFSLRGCHLIAMLARTAIAKKFRVWVLDVLENLNKQKSLPETTTPSTPADRKPLRSLVNAWAKIANVHQSALWPQVRAHFQLERIDDLPVEWIPQALAFVQGKIDEFQGLQQKALPEARPFVTPALPLPPAMSRGEIDRLHMEMREHMHKAAECGSMVCQRLDACAKKMEYTHKHNVMCYLQFSFNSFADAWEAIAEAMKETAKAMAQLQEM